MGCAWLLGPTHGNVKQTQPCSMRWPRDSVTNEPNQMTRASITSTIGRCSPNNCMPHKMKAVDECGSVDNLYHLSNSAAFFLCVPQRMNEWNGYHGPDWTSLLLVCGLLPAAIHQTNSRSFTKRSLADWTVHPQNSQWMALHGYFCHFPAINSPYSKLFAVPRF